MRRRGAGALVVTLTVLAAVVVPNIGTRSVRGFAQSATIPAPPAAGDCLLSPISMSTGNDGQFRTPGPATDLIVEPCTGRRYGEVVLMHDSGSLTGFPDGVRIAYPQDDACWSAAQRFLGLPDFAADPTPVLSYWYPAGNSTALELAPGDLQRAAGRTWTACVVLATDLDARSLPYGISARDAFSDGRPPDAFASCTDSADITAFDPVPCDEPHHIEFLGYSGDLVGATASSIDRTCGELAARLTRMPDPTAGGALQVRAAIGHYDEVGVLQPGMQGSDGGFADTAVCRVIAPDDRPLTGTLLGLGDGPVPWS